MSSKDETNATMSQRIDLTQFEGHAPGPWHYEMPPEMGMQIKTGNSYVAELSFLMSNMSPETDDVNPTGLDPDAVDARLILAVPDLLAELKRMYEREDFLMKAREIWLIEERRLEKQVEVYREKMLQSVGRTSDIEKDLRKALRIIRDDLDDALEVYPTINQEDIVKVRNFANDASQ